MRRIRAQARAALIMLALAAGAAPAAPPDAPDAAIMAAVGWIGWGGVPGKGPGCTGVLVAADLVLTAAHCVTRDETRAPADPSALIFAAGWRDGVSAAVRHAAGVALPVPRDLLSGRLRLDLALIRLDAPVPADAAAPLPLDARGDSVASAVTVGYPHAAPERPVVSACTVTRSDAAVTGLDCRAAAGFSGGPVLVRRAAGWRVAAIMVARGTGTDRTGTYAVTVPDDLRTLIGQP